MSVRAPRCGKHPSHLLVGVCAFCLRERLAGLADAECASDALHNRRKKHSPARAPAARPHGAASKGMDKPVVVEAMSAQASARKKPNRLSAMGASPKSAAAQPLGPANTQAPKHRESRGSGTMPSTYLAATAAIACDASSSKEMLPGKCNPSSVIMPSFTQPDCGKMPPLEIKIPIAENAQNAGTDSSSNVRKHTAIPGMSPTDRIAEQAKLTACANQGQHVPSFDSKKKIANSLHGVQRSLPSPEPAGESIKEEVTILSGSSPSFKHKKKTLSSLFSLDDADFRSSKSKFEETRNRSNAKAVAVASAHYSSYAKAMQRRCKHGSFSERVEPSTYLFPVPEAVSNKPVSWFSSLFWRRRNKSRSKPGETVANSTECNNGWEDARQSWDAPRPSAWEQFRLSSFEGPRSSWEPARPSWEGVMRTSDAESVFSGFDYPLESLVDVKEDLQVCMQRNKQDCTAVDRRSLDNKKLGLKSKPLAPKIPHSDDKSRPHSFLPAKASLMQRDVSTQTTPPRSSDATEIFIQQRLQQGHHRHQQHQVKPPNAIWSKVWSKTFSNSKWAFKQKHQKERQPKETMKATVPVEEEKEQGHLTLGRSSFHEGAKPASNYHPKLTFIDNIEEHEAWDTFYSPLQQAKDAVTRLVSKGDMCNQRDEQPNKARDTNVAVENGLLKFYLTPVRDHSRSKQGIHGL